MHDCAAALSTPTVSCHHTFSVTRFFENRSLLHRLASGWIVTALFIAMACFLLPTRLSAQYTQSVLYNFCSDSQDHCPDGNTPMDTPPLFDAHGNIFGATTSGGAYGKGVVYELTPSGGGYTQSVLYSFCPQSGCLDGSLPYGALALDTQGNLYGVTENGGTNNVGVLYELSPSGGGTWTQTVIYTFCNCNTGGGSPISGPIFDAHGNLYGTASTGGTGHGGIVYELSPSGGGTWTPTVLYNFCSLQNCADGGHPYAGLIFDSQGALYGATTNGGNQNNGGTVFKLTPGGGTWTESTLYSFCPVAGCTDGQEPQGRLVFDSQGNLYGTTVGGGSQNYGTVFALSPSGGGSWTESVLENFCPQPTCVVGYYPVAGLTFDQQGNLFGTAPMGGVNGDGTAFELTPAGGGQWTFSVIHQFCSVGGCHDGDEPVSGLTFHQGNFYGTASAGLYCCGIVYELSPPQLVPTTTTLTSAPNPSFLGVMVTLTATVHAQNGTLPTGTVTFESNGAQIGSASLNNQGVAVLNYNALPVGTDSLVATYNGSSTLAPSTSNTVQQVVNPANSHTAVASSPNPSTSGQQVTITATITPPGPPAPTGTVGFTSNGTAISGCTAVPLMGTAQCATSSLAVGTDAIVATYSGDGNYNGSSGSVTQIVNPIPEALQFVTLPPCRVVDTRNANGTFGGPPLQGNASRAFPLAQSGNPCNIPANAVAYSLNVTVVPMGRLSYLTIWPTGEGQPTVSTLNSPDGRTKANAVIIPAGTSSGSVSVFVTNTTNVLLDIDGYFIPASGQTLAFYALTPCRVADTRNPDGPLGGPSLQAGHERDFPVLESSCGLPQNAAAYSLNFTAVPKGSRLGYLTVWPQGSSQPQVSTLNDPTGTTVANAALVPSGTNGGIATYANNDTDLIIDVNGYFGPAGSGGLSFYALTPCRVIDTRSVGNGQPFSGELTVNVVDSPCGPPATSEGYVFNATVIPQGALGYLTLWPDSEGQPGVSTLNARDGALTSNMAIVPNIDGKTDAWAQGTTQLILDISGYFAP